MVTNLMHLSPVFRVLPQERRAQLLSRFSTMLVEAEDDIIVEGQIGRGLYIILDGLVQVTLRKGGKRHLLNWLREGDIFGEISLLRQTSATATCTASRRSLLMFLAREDFETIPHRVPGSGLENARTRRVPIAGENLPRWREACDPQGHPQVQRAKLTPGRALSSVHTTTSISYVRVSISPWRDDGHQKHRQEDRNQGTSGQHHPRGP
jgi:hypothetical protein